jgi:hypothetical protein
MIQISSLHHQNTSKNNEIIRSHKLTPHDGITLFFSITGPRENIISILEDHFLEKLSGVEWSTHGTDTDFSFVSDSYNHFIQNIAEGDRSGISVLFAALSPTGLLLSTIGRSSVVLVERGGETTEISNTEEDAEVFHYISSGEVPPGGAIYLSSHSLDDVIGSDMLYELAQIEDDSWTKTLESILRKEESQSIHITRLYHKSSPSLQ